MSSGYVSVADREKNSSNRSNSKNGGLESPTAAKNSGKEGASLANSAKATIAAYTSSQFVGGLLPFLFWTAVIAFVIFLVLLLIHYTVYPVFSFNPGDGGLIPVPAASDEYTFSKGEIVAKEKEIEFLEALGDKHIPKPCGFTVSMDVYDQGVVSSEQPRILFYRSAGLVTPVTTGANAFTFTSSTSLADKVAKLKAQFPASDLVVYLDPGLNNLNVGVQVIDSGSTTRFQNIGPIENTPVRIPYRVTITYMKELIEIYINGKLKKSTPLTSPPIDSSTAGATKLWSRFDGQTTALISHVSYWGRILSAREIAAHGGAKTPAVKFNP